MLKRNQVRGLAQTRNRDKETHVSENPADDVDNDRVPEDSFHV
jgi:hypothetical protein